MPIDRPTAVKLVQDEIARICGNGEAMTVLHNKVLERSWGWFVPWLALVDMEAGNPPAPGIAPFLVLRETGELKALSTANFTVAVLSTLGDNDGGELLKELGRTI